MSLRPPPQVALGRGPCMRAGEDEPLVTRGNTGLKGAVRLQRRVEVAQCVGRKNVLERARFALPPGATTKLTNCASKLDTTPMDRVATF